MTRDLDVCYLQLGHYVRKVSFKFHILKTSLMIIYFQIVEGKEFGNGIYVDLFYINRNCTSYGI